MKYGRRWLGAVAVGVMVLAGMGRDARGQGAKPDAGAVEEARRLNGEVERLYGEGKYDEAIPLAERALAMREATLGPEHMDVGESLANLAELYHQHGDYGRAVPLLQRSLGIYEKSLGPEHPFVATVVSNLAVLYADKGDYARAEPLLQRSLAINEKVLGPEHRAVATMLGNLASLYIDKGDYVRAEPLLQRSIAVAKKSQGPAHDVAFLLINLGGVYLEKGDYARAEPLFQQSLGIYEKALGPEHPSVAYSLNNLARVYQATGDHTRAEPNFQRALRIWEKELGPDHPNVALLLKNLATFYRDKNDFARAEPLFRRALAIFEKASGPDHPLVALTLTGLAILYRMKHDDARAAPLLQRALAAREKSLGPEHPLTAIALNNLADLHLAQNDVPAALEEKRRAASIADRNAVRELAVGADEQRRAYMATLRMPTHSIISLHLQAAPDVREAKELALQTILRRKGLVLDAMANSFAMLRERLGAADQSRYDEWVSLGAQYSTLAQRGPGKRPLDEYRATLKALDDERQKIENELSFRSKELQAQLRPITIAEVQAVIPKGAALVELFRYQPFMAKEARIEASFGPARYVAYVLPHAGEATYADLGEAAPIEDAVKALRNALSRAATDPKPAASNLYGLVMAPIQKLLGTTRHVYLSPDGALNLVPFDAMMDEHGRHLVETHAITYLQSGRDLVRMGNPTSPRENSAVFAGPAYDAGDANGPRAQRQFTPLRYSADEGRTIGALLAGTRTLEGPAATEVAFKALHGPKILHVSTHGFFDRDMATLHAATREDPDAKPRWIENALLYSGLAFAGANRGGAGKDDGLLTALEASQLDLRGTKLVVLSACNTGMGQAENGEGVYGLRRAFSIAGAETVVMSLWQVDARATTDLMKAYHHALAAGGGRAEALRQAQLAMLASGERSHPHYWSSFIVSGDERAINGRSVEPTFAEVKPGPRGCACEAGRRDSGAAAWACVMAALAITASRRRISRS